MPYNRFLFYLSYIYYKVVIIAEVSDGWFFMYLNELLWFISKFVKLPRCISDFAAQTYYETIFGRFKVSKELLSNISVSPSYERLDINLLIKQISSELKNNRRILFIDVGAYNGLYAIAVGNRFRSNSHIQIMAFEPGTSYLSQPTYRLLRDNIRLNRLDNIRLFHVGLGSRNVTYPSTGEIPLKKLDSVLSPRTIALYDSIFMKVDVDGAERQVLKGACKTIGNSKRFQLLIEDFVDPVLLVYLHKHFEFLTKRTKYNSFWRKNNAAD